MNPSDFTIVIPAKNESQGLSELLPQLKSAYAKTEIIVVNDGSTDNTSDICASYGVKELYHPYSQGNGASIKAGAREAKTDFILFMDGDGQHRVEDIKVLWSKLAQGYDMVVGARERSGQANKRRWAANSIYNWLASWIVGHKVLDLTSGMRLVNRQKFLEFINLLPNKFSYPTTITMTFFRAGYKVAYVPIRVLSRMGESHIDIKKDGVRFLLIIFKIGTLYSPLKVFLPISFGFFLTGFLYYIYTYVSDGRFTNMGVLLFSVSILIFLMGLISEQITALLYQK